MRRNGIILLIVLLLIVITTIAWASPDEDNVRQSLDRTAAYLWQKEKTTGPLSPWSYIALAAAGRDLKGTKADQACEKVLAAAASSGEMNDYATLVLVLLAAGGDPHNYQGQNLVQKIKDARLASGKFADNVIHGGEQLLNAHIWAVLALYAAGADIPDRDKALKWLINQQHTDGSFYWNVMDKKTSDVDSTGMALMALAALHEDKNSPVVQKAIGYLQRAQKENGGFESWGAENPESCHMVIEGLTAVGINVQGFQKTGGNPLTALLHFQLPDGSFEHIKGMGSNEMATYQSLMALSVVHSGKPFFELLRAKQKAATPSEKKEIKREARFVVKDSRYMVIAQGQKEIRTADATPFIENGRTYVPVRYLAYALGMGSDDIKWDEKEQAVKLTMDGVTVKLIVGSATGYVNGQAKPTGVAPLVRNGRTYLPARFVAEAFDYQVQWDETMEMVIISRE